MSHIEMGSFIILGCLSTFHPLLARYLSIHTEDLSEPSSVVILTSNKNKLGIQGAESSTRQTSESSTTKEVYSE
jgi:hypothetical protein